ncbi:RagB/SusD family nutrient uptake outer membrane protein [Myroides indicus]|uniref:SusD-like starch-binding protein associating with outer membrane n=1 Tax=Myroides indicus TaxID=1323422 RepID=A0A4R7F5A8_9FLAO|nr:RagB/SusD family nutrient uptake outer membrane protein [Myroides indicus]TDS65323.1 SusD-like starch-binding protein associating with outer membrane [Myroides indicus]
MKIRFIKHIALAAVLALGACSKDYLDTYPTDETSPSTVFETTEGVEMAVNGLAKIMVTQHLETQGFNGEGTIKMYYGEYPGNNFRVNLPGWGPLINGEYFEKSDVIYNYYPWHYYYMLINNANVIIDKVDEAEGPAATKEYLKAQALAYRAYSYTMLSQIYGYRWDASGNGSQKCLVLRTSSVEDPNQPMVSLNEIYKQVYQDLDLSISLFEKSGYKRSANHQIDKNVAQAIYARAAIVKKDYETAAKYAALAREGYPLMNNQEYKNGFANPTSEWIWGSFGASDEQLYFFSYQAYIAYNSSASSVRVYPKRMSKELYETIPNTDIRKELFLNPEGYEGQYVLNSGETESGSEMDKAARAAFPGLQSNAVVAAYMQFKIKANDMPGVGHLNHFRSSEMYLIEAEAKHFLGQDGEAAQLLEELTQGSGRDTEYVCSKTGDELFKEIVKYRGIELWGEGFDWFDMKRWGLPIIRKTGKDGGNYPELLAIDKTPNANNNWTWVTPAKEYDFNSALKE